jgi:hypothetical protein
MIWATALVMSAADYGVDRARSVWTVPAPYLSAGLGAKGVTRDGDHMNLPGTLMYIYISAMSSDKTKTSKAHRAIVTEPEVLGPLGVLNLGAAFYVAESAASRAGGETQ